MCGLTKWPKNSYKSYFWIRAGRTLSSHISYIYRINIMNMTCLLLTQHICRTCNWARHLSVGSLMVRTSHRSSEGCGLDPRLLLRNRFSEVRAWRTFIYPPRYLQTSTFSTHIALPTVIWHVKVPVGVDTWVAIELCALAQNCLLLGLEFLERWPSGRAVNSFGIN